MSLANNSVYGLGASVWTEKLSLALEVAMMIKVEGGLGVLTGVLDWGGLIGKSDLKADLV